MIRTGMKLMAATALTLSLGTFALAENHDAAESDCPEDSNTTPGCQMEGAAESERQPVPGAATAPVAPAAADGEAGDKTMAGPESDAATEAAAEDCPEDDDTAPGCDMEGAVESESQPVPGAATAPVPAEAAEGEEGDKTMESPETEEEDGADAGGAVEGDPNLAVAEEEGGRYYTADGVPTFNVAADGTVDWLTYSGFRRYHSECHVCHGPDGEGSTYAPAIKVSAVEMEYWDFFDVVVNGRQNGNSVMPHFGDNPNVMCYLDDIYVYLKARGADVVPRGRPASKEAKSEMIQEDENGCMG